MLQMNKNILLKKEIDKQLLKIIAVIFMLCDHIAVIILVLFVSQSKSILITYNLLREIGRMSFPIFLFCIFDGMIYTKNINKYILKVTIIGLLSIIPFNLAFHNIIFFQKQNNILITFSILIICFSFYVKYGLNYKKLYISYTLLFFSFFLSCCITKVLHCEYGLNACICVLILLFFKNNNRIGIIIYIIYLSIFNNIFCIVTLPFLLMYNGKKTLNNKLDKFFYIFYPLHLLLLYIVKITILNYINI